MDTRTQEYLNLLQATFTRNFLTEHPEAAMTAATLVADRGETLDVHLGKSENGFDRSTEGETPLTLAIKSNRIPVINHLLELGADPDFANANGQTPAQIAMGQSNAMLIGGLLAVTQRNASKPAPVLGEFTGRHAGTKPTTDTPVIR